MKFVAAILVVLWSSLAFAQINEPASSQPPIRPGMPPNASPKPTDVNSVAAEQRKKQVHDQYCKIYPAAPGCS